MLEFERNRPIDPAVLADLFARCGWAEEGADVKLGWALAASEEWIVCRLDGEVIGFGRSCRLGPIKRVVFDVLVDPRFNRPLLRGQIVRLLAQNAGSLEEVSVFTEHGAEQSAGPASAAAEMTKTYTGGLYIPPASPGAYLGPAKTTEEDR
jgi:hypothetical protein